MAFPILVYLIVIACSICIIYLFIYFTFKKREVGKKLNRRRGKEKQRRRETERKDIKDQFDHLLEKITQAKREQHSSETFPKSSPSSFW